MLTREVLTGFLSGKPHPSVLHVGEESYLAADTVRITLKPGGVLIEYIYQNVVISFNEMPSVMVTGDSLVLNDTTTLIKLEITGT